MKDKLLYLTVGLLVGIVVMQWTSSPGPRAGYVQPSGTGIISLLTFDSNNFDVLDENGQEWRFSFSGTPLPTPSCWNPMGVDLPVPIQDVKMWSRNIVVTTDDHVWLRLDAGTWHDCGAWPGGPVPTESSTIGGVKGQYQGKD